MQCLEERLSVLPSFLGLRKNPRSFRPPEHPAVPGGQRGTVASVGGSSIGSYGRRNAKARSYSYGALPLAASRRITRDQFVSAGDYAKECNCCCCLGSAFAFLCFMRAVGLPLGICFCCCVTENTKSRAHQKLVEVSRQDIARDAAAENAAQICCCPTVDASFRLTVR